MKRPSRRRPLFQQVVVITGASSGIGRLAALRLAEHGCRVVVVARRAEALQTLVEEIRKGGGTALAVPGDVTREEDLRRAAAEATSRFGRIDAWVNNAAVYLQGRVQDITLAEYRRLLEVNFLGQVNGIQRALEVMLPQGEGTIVCVSSVAARRGVPYTSAYAASKSALEGLVSTLRSELWGSGISFSVLYPPTVDTLIYHHGRGKLGVMPKPAPTVASAEAAVEALIHLVRTGERERYFGWAAPLVFLNQVAPRVCDWLLHHGRGFTYSDEPAGADNLDSPSWSMPPRVSAGWREQGWRGVTLRETVRVLPWESLAAAGLLGFLGGRLWKRLG